MLSQFGTELLVHQATVSSLKAARKVSSNRVAPTIGIVSSIVAHYWMVPCCPRIGVCHRRQQAVLLTVLHEEIQRVTDGPAYCATWCSGEGGTAWPWPTDTKSKIDSAGLRNNASRHQLIALGI
eukprot:TRINITY_DN11351_c0_g1_i4.p3 TRINITY_DN11351_c0_g1~~TRINITY_DN11351_c0_g1_i4.p3  ORF type:complete len:124 (-),score=8.30 TRINITY_DN11351_c0_g1_i4:1881-2252(-)